MQYSFDIFRFSDLLSKYTGVSKQRIDKFLQGNPVNYVFEHPTALTTNAAQINKINELKELHNLYNNLKNKEKGYVITSSADAGQYLINYFKGIKDKEKVVCAYLSNKNEIIKTEEISQGTINEAAVYTREIAKIALLYDANNVIMAHNHPGGAVDPSQPDLKVTQDVANSLKTLRIKLLDHIIVSNNQYCSIGERYGMYLVPTINEKEKDYSCSMER